MSLRQGSARTQTSPVLTCEPQTPPLFFYTRLQTPVLQFRCKYPGNLNFGDSLQKLKQKRT